MHDAAPSHPITSLHLFAAGGVKLSLTQARVFIAVLQTGSFLPSYMKQVSTPSFPSCWKNDSFS